MMPAILAVLTIVPFFGFCNHSFAFLDTNYYVVPFSSFPALFLFHSLHQWCWPDMQTQKFTWMYVSNNFIFSLSLVQLCKSNLHALAPAQVGVDACIVHKQVNTIHLQSHFHPFSIVNLRRLRPLTAILMVQTLKYASHSSKSLSTFKGGLKNWEKIEKRWNHTYFENCSCLVTSHWTNVTLIFEIMSRIFGTFVSMRSPNLLLAKLFPQLLQGGKPSLLPHVRDTHPGDKIDVQLTQLLCRDK